MKNTKEQNLHVWRWVKNVGWSLNARHFHTSYQILCLQKIVYFSFASITADKLHQSVLQIDRSRQSSRFMSTKPRQDNRMSQGYLTREPGFATKAIHVGNEPEQWSSCAVVPPISMSTTFKQQAPGIHKGFDYGRSGNPTRQVLERCLASLENAKYGLCFSSGLGTATSILSMLKAGDDILAGDELYGGTYELLSEVIDHMNIKTTFVDCTDPNNVKNALHKNIKLIWMETPTNPLLKLADIAEISKIVHNYNKDIIVVVDNTFLTSYFQQPLHLGANISMYSLTKYMNGHTDVIMGAVVTNNDALYTKMKFLQNAMGTIPSPFDCYLVNRSLKTLSIRMDQHMKNGLIVAKYLESNKFVEKVVHPGLPSHPQHELLKKQCYGYCGMVSFYLKGGVEHSKKFLSSLKVFTLAESLGGFESLAEIPSLLTHASIPEEERIRLGITDNLIRMTVGLESAEDLVADLEQALNATKDI